MLCCHEPAAFRCLQIYCTMPRQGGASQAGSYLQWLLRCFRRCLQGVAQQAGKGLQLQLQGEWEVEQGQGRAPVHI